MSGANLSHAILNSANLHNANLTGAIIYNTNLSVANLYGAKLSNANLCKTSLFYINLCNATLCNAKLSYANLNHANLYSANLSGAMLTEANLCFTELSYANLTDADLSYANLFKANLTGAITTNAKFQESNFDVSHLKSAKGALLEYRTGKMLSESIIGYKKCQNDIIVTLEIPKGAIVFSINGNKCRTNKAKVIAIDGAQKALSKFNYMSYYVGDEITVYNFNCQYNIECGSGIHFFMTKEEAEMYT